MPSAELLAERALEGVGDKALGEWREAHTAFHIRRRLSAAEQQKYGLTAIDMRCTEAGIQRMHKLAKQRPDLRNFILEELKP